MTGRTKSNTFQKKTESKVSTTYQSQCRLYKVIIPAIKQENKSHGQEKKWSVETNPKMTQCWNSQRKKIKNWFL